MPGGGILNVSAIVFSGYNKKGAIVLAPDPETGFELGRRYMLSRAGQTALQNAWHAGNLDSWWSSAVKQALALSERRGNTAEGVKSAAAAAKRRNIEHASKKIETVQRPAKPTAGMKLPWYAAPAAFVVLAFVGYQVSK